MICNVPSRDIKSTSWYSHETKQTRQQAAFVYISFNVRYQEDTSIILRDTERYITNSTFNTQISLTQISICLSLCQVSTPVGTTPRLRNGPTSWLVRPLEIPLMLLYVLLVYEGVLPNTDPERPSQEQSFPRRPELLSLDPWLLKTSSQIGMYI